MIACPRCDAPRAVVFNRDIYGEVVTCLTCGWNGDTRSPVPDASDPPQADEARWWKTRQNYNIDPALYARGAPKPSVNDYVNIAGEIRLRVAATAREPQTPGGFTKLIDHVEVLAQE